MEASESSSDNQFIMLHGDLDLKIVEAQHLPNLSLIDVRQLRRCFTARDSYTIETRQHKPKVQFCNPYVEVLVSNVTVASTRVIKNTTNPKWNQYFHIPLAHPVNKLTFHVKDDDIFGAEIIGTVHIPASKIATGEFISNDFDILSSSKKPLTLNSKIHLVLQFTSFDKNPRYEHGIASDKGGCGVARSYFPLRKGGSVRLYQDAHVPDGLLPEIELDGGKVFKHEKCWEDICSAISEAHHLIYIVGWSVFHKVKLVREQTRPPLLGGDSTLGELLKFKSEEGVRVLMLVWDDKTSGDSFFKTGMMQTHDEETRKFFKHSSVTCVLTPRNASSKLGYIKQQVVGTVFTHHQKCVLVDTQALGSNRKITAFLGGIDLCDGRYDTPDHRLFRDLDTVFQNDYRNPTFPAGTKSPRQPWHDLHCRVEGPAAYDVLINFEQLWRKATKWKELGLRFKRVSHWHDDALLKIERVAWILSPAPSIKKDGSASIQPDDPTLWISSEDDPESWHVQIFRSIDSGSVKGFPKTVEMIENKNLICSKKLVIDKSIQTGYIQAIRSAQHFIYIENQYFFGSSYAWPSYKNAGADNLIPMELALKIASKIRAKERFAVYIVIPMWPEGDPTSVAMQAILFWQGQTMQMMYDIVAQELDIMQLVDSNPLDYLNFYCLGNREDISEERLGDNADKVSDTQKFKRFMIYVHAKGMIVDDEYVIAGSANINERSMAGTKDTEIAMGAYQPHHSWASRKKHPRGQVYGYRMSLWAEHLGKVDTCFKEPESLECVNTVNGIAKENWKRYTDKDFTPLQGHLLKYPVQVDKDGKVSPLPGQENFPDVGGKVLGVHSVTLPDTLTT
ncbi:phospholipase D delta-like isoform X3 [Quercus robur]|uniref:phospholipase D delta-like isoform X3 n=1 Tax=Quercus robur TaxID=38942 RepID=UPI002162EDAB|nr:phospholipase D delta-like isoform X3 [Quercus robur]